MTEHIAEMGKEPFFEIVHPYKIGYNCNIKSKFLWPTDKMAEKLAKENPGTTAFYRFADFENYYPRRLKTDEFLYNNFIRLGGKPKEKHPLSFVLQGCDYLDNWFGKGISYKIKLNEICPDSISFSLGDSCAQYERTGKIQQLTQKQLLAQMNDYDGGAVNFMRYISEHYSYIEAQLWEDNVILRNKFVVNE